MALNYFDFLYQSFRVSLLITLFVFTMMMFVEIINVSTTGYLSRWLRSGNFLTYFIIVGISSLPGCLGGFTTISLYLHNVISRGVLIGSMIAASGDEAFVLLAMAPKKALLIFTLLFFYGIIVAILLDRLTGKRCYLGKECKEGLLIHVSEENEKLFRKDFLKWSYKRGLYALIYFVMFFLVVIGIIGEEEWNWERYALISTSIIGLLTIIFSSDHFIEEHLTEHIVKKHVLKIFLWTFFAILFMDLVKLNSEKLYPLIKGNYFVALITAALLGILPESGPHIIFVAGYAEGIFPLSVLLTSSIVQDGHSMLPLLAESRKEFIVVKAANLIMGLLLGFTLYFIGL